LRLLSHALRFGTTQNMENNVSQEFTSDYLYQIVPVRETCWKIQSSYNGGPFSYINNPWNGGLIHLECYSEDSAKKFIDKRIKEELDKKRAEAARLAWQKANTPRIYP